MNSGQRCFVIGNGPSLNQMDLGRLAGESTWVMNRGYLLLDRLGWTPSFYVTTDPLGVADDADGISALVDRLPGTIFFLPAARARDRTLDVVGDHVRWFESTWIDTATNGGVLPPGTITALPDAGVMETYTVTVAAVQLAAFMGFSPIYLIGCDTNFAPPSDAEVVEVDTSSGTQTLVMGSAPDTNHFDARYHRPGARLYVPPLDATLSSYAAVRSVCEDIGVEVRNATVGGALEIFPRVGFDTLFD